MRASIRDRARRWAEPSHVDFPGASNAVSIVAHAAPTDRCARPGSMPGAVSGRLRQCRSTKVRTSIFVLWRRGACHGRGTVRSRGSMCERGAGRRPIASCGRGASALRVSPSLLLGPPCIRQLRSLTSPKTIRTLLVPLDRTSFEHCPCDSAIEGTHPRIFERMV